MSHCNRDKFNYFWICEPLARCAKLGSSLTLGTPMEIDFTSAYLHYPLPQCSKIVTPIIFSISYELFRLPSAKVPQDYQLLRTFVWKVDPEQWAISSSRTGHDTKRKNSFWLFATNGRIDAVLLFATGKTTLKFWRKEERRFEWSILMKGKITQRPSSQTDANSSFTISLNNPRAYVSQWKLY